MPISPLQVQALQTDVNRCLRQGDVAGAICLIDDALASNPDAPILEYVKGQVLAMSGQIDCAIRLLSDLIDTKAPQFADVAYLLATLHDERGQPQQAFDRLFPFAQNSRSFYGACIHYLQKTPGVDNATLYDAAMQYANHHCRPFEAVDTNPQFTFRKDRPIRVGYCCAFWDNLTARVMILPVARTHDRGSFTVFGYGTQPVSEGTKEAFDFFRIIPADAEEHFRNQVISDGIDILVEFSSLVRGSRLPTMANRCAPVQISHLHLGTTGIPNIDYILGDHTFVPLADEHFYTEEICRLPGCFFLYDYQELNPRISGPCPWEKNNHITFGCLGSGSKINSAVVRLWAEVLRRTPGSVLFLQNQQLNSAENRRLISKRFNEYGIHADRLRLYPGTDYRGVIESYDSIDICLDTFPWCGGHTIVEALYQGVPTITLRGDRFASSYGASILVAAGCKELIASSTDDYVELAVKLARSPQCLRSYRASLRRQCHDYGICDTVTYTRNLEQAYRHITNRIPQSLEEESAGVSRRTRKRLRQGHQKRDSVHRFGADLLQDLNRHIRTGPIRVIFDVGANTGQSANEFSRCFPDALIYAFEPSPETFTLLVEHTKDKGNIHALPFGLAEESGVRTFYASTESCLNSLLPAAHQWPWKRAPLESAAAISFKTVEAICEERGISCIDFLKIDVQGAEMLVLKGCGDKLRSGLVRAIKLELVLIAAYENQSRFDELYRYMHECGFVFCGLFDPFYDTFGRLCWCDLLFIHSSEHADLPSPVF